MIIPVWKREGYVNELMRHLQLVNSGLLSSQVSGTIYFQGERGGDSVLMCWVVVRSPSSCFVCCW